MHEQPAQSPADRRPEPVRTAVPSLAEIAEHADEVDARVSRLLRQTADRPAASRFSSMV
jgi:hypothetical protein